MSTPRRRRLLRCSRASWARRRAVVAFCRLSRLASISSPTSGRDVAASRSPVGRELEPAATQHVVVGATLRVPAASCGTDVALERDVGARLLQPGDHLRPGAEHDLVHDVELVAGVGDETGIDEASIAGASSDGMSSV